MTIKMIPVPTSIASAELSALSARTYKSSYTAVPNTKLPTLVQQGASKVYEALTGNALPMDDSTFAVSAKDGMFVRFYAPKLYRGSLLEDGTQTPALYIRWGNERIELIADGERVAPAYKSSAKVSMKFATFNPSAKGEDPALELKVTYKSGSDSDVYIMLIAVAPEDWKGFDAERYNTVAETDAEALLALLGTESSGKGSRGSQGETTDRKSLLTAVFGSPEEQTRNLEFAVTGYRPVSASYGVTAIIQLAGSVDADVIAAYPSAAAPFCVWADGKAKDVLCHGATIDISETNPARLVMPVGGRSMLILGTQAQVAGAIDLNFD